MIISDLNYLENTSEEIFGGIGTDTTNRNVSVTRVFTDVAETFNKQFNLNSEGVQGNVAEFNVSADATGPRTFSSLVASAQTEVGRSESFANGTAVTAE
ncbi:hypothetical protein [Nostoc sp. UHCC 0251]|uniref:hypothetical protein n=1 Tax=Nostoc sp. UHCC 0251 TaxID=3110240 RepID=UPI002B21F1A0|nr:hypothetical protein [Nostoc sp. UHCC 0251]MEA5623810.1 hypothetical protein [Nostoc sp. UHCC 0251]